MEEPELGFLDRLTWAHLAALYAGWLFVIFLLPADLLLPALGISYAGVAWLLWQNAPHEEAGTRLVTAIGFGAFYFGVLASPVLLFGDLRSYSSGGLGDDTCYSERGSYPC